MAGEYPCVNNQNQGFVNPEEYRVDTPELLGTIPQWITAGGVLGFAGLLIRWRLGERKLSIEADQVEVKAEELAGNERADIRDAYAELQRQIVSMGQHHLDREREIDERWRRVLAESEERHADCVKQRNDLALRVLEVEKRLHGTIQQFIHFQRRVAEAVARGGNAIEVLASLQPFTEIESDGSVG
jgi:hypothetical protein